MAANAHARLWHDSENLGSAKIWSTSADEISEMAGGEPVQTFA